jgi:acyl-homoserine lactone acylase PvdQ
MASDLLDIQARAILPAMLKTVEAGKAKLPNEDHHRLNTARHLLNNWNFEFDKNSVAASVYTSFEFQLSTYMHETKIEGVNARR